MEQRSGFSSRLQMHKGSSRRHLSNDRICSLPDEVLLIILSFLPLKEMVKTSILSRRWLNLWANTPVLDFDLDLVDGYKDNTRCYFVKCVNHVLHQHKGLCLKKFRVCCNMLHYYMEHVDRWLEFAFARKVEVLELDFMRFGYSFDDGSVYGLNDCWFSCGNANVDGGKSRVLQSNLKLLKSLSLKYVTVTDDAVNFFLRNCPLLERLELCGSQSLVNLVISDPTLVLKHLQIKHGHKMEALSISLETTVGDLLLRDLSMVVHLSILGRFNSLKHILSQKSTCLRQLESLKLCVSELKEVTELLSNLAQLTKLKRLVINYTAFGNEPLIALMSVIESCNHLEEFVLELDWGDPDHERESINMLMVEGRSSPSLKLFEFKGYYGYARDAEFMMHVAKHAPLLEKIIIDPWNVTRRMMKFPETDYIREARRFALNHIEELREAKCIPPHVDVLIL